MLKTLVSQGAIYIKPSDDPQSDDNEIVAPTINSTITDGDDDRPRTRKCLN